MNEDARRTEDTITTLEDGYEHGGFSEALYQLFGLLLLFGKDILLNNIDDLLQN